MKKNEKPSEEVIIPNQIAVFEDRKTGFKTASFPFTFPDGRNGIVSVTRLSRTPWIPSDDIETVHVVWNKNKQFQD